MRIICTKNPNKNCLLIWNCIEVDVEDDKDEEHNQKKCQNLELMFKIWNDMVGFVCCQRKIPYNNNTLNLLT